MLTHLSVKGKYMNYRCAVMVLLVAITLSACSSIDFWPFGEDKKSQQNANTPANSTEYQCSGGKKFYVRLLDKGNTAWLILPDREVSLAKTGSSPALQYSNSVSTLTITGNTAALDVSPTSSYADCKAMASRG